MSDTIHKGELFYRRKDASSLPERWIIKDFKLSDGGILVILENIDSARILEIYQKSPLPKGEKSSLEKAGFYK